MSIQQQQQQPLESIQHPSFNFGHQLQQLVRLQQHPPMQNNANSNIVVGHSLTGLHQVQQQHQVSFLSYFLPSLLPKTLLRIRKQLGLDF